MQIIKDAFYFSIVLIVIGFSFAVAMDMLANGDQKKIGTLSISFGTIYRMAYGDFNADEYNYP